MMWSQKSSTFCLDYLKTSKKGLSSQEVIDRQKKYGFNRLPIKPPESFLKVFLRQFNNIFLYMLIAAALMKLFLGGYQDAAIIFIILTINAFVGALQEGKAQAILAKLKDFTQTKCVVIRDGVSKIVDEKELVPGDIILLQEGERVPADARIIASNELKIDEAILTGESTGVSKHSRALPEKKQMPAHEQNNIAFMGTAVISGNAEAVVVATGLATEIGKIHTTIKEIGPTELPLQKELSGFSRYFIGGSLVLFMLLFGVGLLTGKSIESLFLALTSLFISSVPESLPIIITIVLALGAYRMAKANMLVKKLPAIEALGRLDVLVVDKTGTLTRNEQMITDVFANGAFFTVSGAGYLPDGAVFDDNKKTMSAQKQSSPLWELARAAALLDETILDYEPSKKTVTLKGEPIEAALGLFAKKLGVEKGTMHHDYPRVKEIPFNPETKTSTFYYACPHSDENLMIVLGSPERIMSYCCPKKIDQHLADALETFLQKGLRTLAIASKQIKNFSEKKSKEQHENLHFLGLIGMQDAIRPSITTTVATIKNAGIDIVMATGDHKETALYVARSVGIYKKNDTILDGDSVRNTPPNKLDATLPRTTVLARMTPQDKLAVVHAYHRLGRVVAMTGDGVNDVPALVAADVGIAMGQIGTQVAQEAADVVLLDDSLKSIAGGIAQGRHTLKTMHRVIIYIFTENSSEILLLSITIFLGLPLPLLATQILWENMVTEAFMDVALSLEKPDPDDELLAGTMPVKGVLDKRSLYRLVIMTPIITGIALTTFMLFYKTDLAYARTMTLITLAIAQWFNAWNMRSEEHSIFSKNFFTNYWLMGLTVSVIALQLAAVYTPFLQQALRFVPLAASDWFFAIGISSIVLVVEEIRKFLRSHK